MCNMEKNTPSFEPIALDSHDFRVFGRVAGIGFGVWFVLVAVIALFFPKLIFVPASTTAFSDFAETLSFALSARPYQETQTFYPPFSFLILYPFAWLCGEHISAYLADQITIEELCAQPAFVLSYLLYFTIHMALIVWLVLRLFRVHGTMRIAVVGLILSFGPFLFCFLRGNNTLTMCLFVVLFFCLESSTKQWVRECGFFALAVAISIKIYPVFFCLYLAWRYRGAQRVWVIARTALYTIILSFTPFLFMEGNPLLDIWELLQNAASFSGGNFGANTWPTNVSFDTIIFYVCFAISFIFGGQDVILLRQILKILICAPLFATAVYFALSAPSKRCHRDFVTLSTCLYVLLPSVSNGYCLMVMVIPFIYTLLTWQSHSARQRKFYLICYSLILCGGLYTFGLYIGASVATMALMLDALRRIAQSKRPDAQKLD